VKGQKSRVAREGLKKTALEKISGKTCTGPCVDLSLRRGGASSTICGVVGKLPEGITNTNTSTDMKFGSHG